MNINSFRTQFLTMKKKASRLQREVSRPQNKQSGIQSVAIEMFLLTNNVDFTEEVIATRAEESEVGQTPTNVVEEEVVSKAVAAVTKKRRYDVKSQMNSKKRGYLGHEKLEHLVLSSRSTSTENAFLEKSLVVSVSNKQTLLAGRSPKNKAHKVAITEIICSPVSEFLSS